MQDEIGERVSVYSHMDLNADFEFCGRWIALVGNVLFLIEENEFGFEELERFNIDKISKIKEISSISCTTYVFLTADDLPPLATVHFTHRQKVSMGHVKYLVEKLKDDKEIVSLDFDPHEEYANAIIKPVLDAQNSISKDKSKVVWRLLKYLLPYKKQVAIGMVGASLTTLVSLVPAYLSGYLIDSVVRPFQDGGMTKANGLSIA